MVSRVRRGSPILSARCCKSGDRTTDMRLVAPVLLLLLLLLCTPLAFANGSNGNTHLLFDGYGASWASLAGGEVMPLLEPPVRTSAAFDGERFLLAWSASDGVRIAIYDEGAIAPLSTALLDDAAAGDRAPVALWDGARFLVFWSASGKAHGAAVTSTGEIARKVVLRDIESIDDAASNGATIALTRTFMTATHSGNVEVILLDADFRLVRRTVAGTILKSTGGGTTFIRYARIAVFDSGYYAAWQQLRTGRYEDVVGTRITAEGAPLDVVTSTREPQSLMGSLLEAVFPSSATEVYELELIVHRGRLLAIMKRTWGRRVTATAVDVNGATEGPVEVGGKFMMPANAETLVRADGSLALAWFDADRILEVQPFRALGLAPRRRASRH